GRPLGAKDRRPLSVRAEKKASAFGRSPGSWSATRRLRDLQPPSPSPTCVEWVREGGLHLQWRDRAGLDRLPCYAQLGTEGTYSVVRLRLLQPSPAKPVKPAHESVDAARLFRERLTTGGS